MPTPFLQELGPISGELDKILKSRKIIWANVVVMKEVIVLWYSGLDKMD